MYSAAVRPLQSGTVPTPCHGKEQSHPAFSSCAINSSGKHKHTLEICWDNLHGDSRKERELTLIFSKPALIFLYIFKCQLLIIIDNLREIFLLRRYQPQVSRLSLKPSKPPACITKGNKQGKSSFLSICFTTRGGSAVCWLVPCIQELTEPCSQEEQADTALHSQLEAGSHSQALSSWTILTAVGGTILQGINSPGAS